MFLFLLGKFCIKLECTCTTELQLLHFWYILLIKSYLKWCIYTEPQKKRYVVYLNYYIVKMKH